MIFDIKAIVAVLQKNKKLFVSERHLQVEFVLAAKEIYPKYSFYPEYVVCGGGKRYHVDLMICDGNEYTSIEFKYVVKGGVISVAGNTDYKLRDYSGIDVRRYQCVKDVERLENYKKLTNGICTCGYLLLITNMKAFWCGSNTKVGKDFDIRENVNLVKGKHSFEASSKLAQKYVKVELDYAYNNLHYEHYLLDNNGEEFKYLLIKVNY